MERVSVTGIFPAFVQALKAQRDALNARYALRVRSGAKIDSDSFLDHLHQRVAPLVEAVNAEWPGRVPATVSALYEASLDLFAGSLLGPSAKLPELDRVWMDLLPANLRLLACEPVGIVGCLCNAAFQVAQQRGTRLDQWLARMQAALPICDSLARVLEVGQVAAWQAGMAQFRSAALEVAQRLPTNLAAPSLGLSGDLSPQTLTTAMKRLQANPWLTVSAAMEGKAVPQQLKCVGQAGSFTGFGGDFARPPVTTCSAGRLLATDGRSTWQLIADAYGTWFRRLPDGKVVRGRLPADVGVERSGKLNWGKLVLQVPELANPTGFACDGATLAVTIATSHHVFLFARLGGPL